MNPPIQDKFANAKSVNGKPLTKQQRYAKRRTEQGLCTLCPSPAEPSTRKPGKFSPYCKAHKVANRERARKRKGCKRRWKGASSYGGPK